MQDRCRTWVVCGASLATVLACVVGGASSAVAKGGDVGSASDVYLTRDPATGTGWPAFAPRAGDRTGRVYVADVYTGPHAILRGERSDELVVRHGATFSHPGVNDFSYGNPDDVVLFGDWDGDFYDTPMVRRGSWFYLTNAYGGVAQSVFSYGDPGDVVLVGDWDGDGVDTLAVRRGSTFYLRESNTTGVADRVVSYGEPSDIVVVGRWTETGGDTLAVRRGNVFYLQPSLGAGFAEVVFAYGDPTDSPYVQTVRTLQGRGADSVGVRRPG